MLLRFLLVRVFVKCIFLLFLKGIQNIFIFIFSKYLSFLIKSLFCLGFTCFNNDTFHKIASPVSVLVRKKTNIDSMAKDFQTLVSRLSLAGFVVGYPFSLHGQHSVEAVQVRLFMEELRKTGKLDGLSYTYWDENYTSKCVEALLYPLNLHPIEHKTITDKFAAVGILQRYFQSPETLKKTEDYLLHAVKYVSIIL
ncbi:hypothetical protein HPP92_015351 [Vanilla planifolia]|uniref:Uncharacterized protein n=1 Tax=Vanilla planifolia TaxID=51239 RepID=A0A835QSR6_VANPL|nr:hypothetical protein HPP92_015351 [Vanilla planifolia]